MEYVNVCGLRVDGRRPSEVRRLSATLGCAAGADGSALVSLGATRALAVVHGPRRAAPRAAGAAGESTVLGEDSPRAVVTVSFTVAPFAASERRARRAGDRKLVEAAGALRQCFEAVVHTRLYPRSEIAVSVQILASDGGALVAALNAGTLALIDAGVAMRDFVAAAAALHPPLGGAPLLDPCHAETLGGAPELVVALLPGSDTTVLVSMESRLPAEAFQPLLEAAAAGARQTYEALRGFVGERAAEQLAAREGRVGGGGGGGGGGAAAAGEEEEEGGGEMEGGAAYDALAL